MATTTKKKTAKKRYGTHITTPAGERVYVSGRTKAELAEKVAKARLEMGAGVDLANDILFREYAMAWANSYKRPKLRANSFGTLMANLENHVLPFFGAMRVKDIKPLHVQMFLGSINHLSRSAQSKCFQIFSAIMRTAADNGLIFKSPVTSADKVGGTTAEEVEPLTQEQARELLAATKGTRAYTFCLLALTTGLRRGELLGLMWKDIDFANSRLKVTHNKTFPPKENDAPVTTLLKSDAAQRVIPLSPFVLEHLKQELRESESPYVLSMGNGESLTKSSFRKLWAVIESRTVTSNRPLGTVVTGGREGPILVSLAFKCHPHQLRHTCITQWVESGMDFKEVQYLAGHSTLEMTLRVYAHYRRKSREAETATRVSSASAYLLG